MTDLDAEEKLAAAFDDLLSILNRRPEALKSLMGSGLATGKGKVRSTSNLEEDEDSDQSLEFVDALTSMRLEIDDS